MFKAVYHQSVLYQLAFFVFMFFMSTKLFFLVVSSAEDAEDSDLDTDKPSCELTKGKDSFYLVVVTRFYIRAAKSRISFTIFVYFNFVYYFVHKEFCLDST